VDDSGGDLRNLEVGGRLEPGSDEPLGIESSSAVTSAGASANGSVANEPDGFHRPVTVRGERQETQSRGSGRFWRLWLANVLSNLGDGLYQFGFPLLALSVTRSPILVSAVTVTLTLAWPIFGLQAGAIVDRSDRRRVLVTVNGMRCVVLTALTASIVTDTLNLPVLYVAAAALGIGETLVDTALTSIVPALVPSERLHWANGRLVAGQTVSNEFVGPPLAGALIGMAAAAATAVGAALYGLAMACLGLLRGSFRSMPADEGLPVASRATEGFRFLWSHRLLRRLTIFTAAMNLWWAAYFGLIALFAVDPGPMHLTPFGYGLLLIAMGAGGLAGSLAVPWFRRSLGARNTLLVDLIGTALLLGVPTVTTAPAIIGISVAAAGVGTGLWVVVVASIRQRLSPDHLLGRVYSASRLISWGVLPLGAFLGGAAAEVVGIRTVFGAGAVTAIGLTALFVIRVKEREFSDPGG
jgi:MFS family permease